MPKPAAPPAGTLQQQQQQQQQIQQLQQQLGQLIALVQQQQQQPAPMAYAPPMPMQHHVPGYYQTPGAQMPGYLTVPNQGGTWLGALGMNVVRAMAKGAFHMAAHHVDYHPLGAPPGYQLPPGR